jgi:hypothetical protein
MCCLRAGRVVVMAFHPLKDGLRPLNETSRGRSPCGILLRKRSSRRKVGELGARTRDLAGARTRPWAAAILVDTSSRPQTFENAFVPLLQRQANASPISADLQFGICPQAGKVAPERC